MRLTLSKLKALIKEELQSFLEEGSEADYFEKIKTLLLNGREYYNTGMSLFDSIKGTGLIEPQKEEALQLVADCADLFYKSIEIKEEIQVILKPNSKGVSTWWPGYTPEHKKDAQKIRELRNQRKQIEQEKAALVQKLGDLGKEIETSLQNL